MKTMFVGSFDLIYQLHLAFSNDFNTIVLALNALNTYLEMRKSQVPHGIITCRHHHDWFQRKLLHFRHKKEPGKCNSEVLLA